MYQTIEPKIWKYEDEGDLLEGICVAKENGVGKNESWLYSIETPTGVLNVWGSTILDSKFTFVKIGDKVKITYKGLGEAKGGRSAPKLFIVEKDVE